MYWLSTGGHTKYERSKKTKKRKRETEKMTHREVLLWRSRLRLASALFLRRVDLIAVCLAVLDAANVSIQSTPTTSTATTTSAHLRIAWTSRVRSRLEGLARLLFRPDMHNRSNQYCKMRVVTFLITEVFHRHAAPMCSPKKAHPWTSSPWCETHIDQIKKKSWCHTSEQRIHKRTEVYESN